MSPPRRAYMARLRERALFARALASFLPPDVAKLVEASPSSLSLTAELEATVLFCDIRGFSAIAERLDPRQVAELVGRFSSAMAAVVADHGRVVDKFAGVWPRWTATAGRVAWPGGRSGSASTRGR